VSEGGREPGVQVGVKSGVNAGARRESGGLTGGGRAVGGRRPRVVCAGVIARCGEALRREHGPVVSVSTRAMWSPHHGNDARVLTEKKRAADDLSAARWW